MWYTVSALFAYYFFVFYHNSLTFSEQENLDRFIMIEGYDHNINITNNIICELFSIEILYDFLFFFCFPPFGLFN